MGIPDTLPDWARSSLVFSSWALRTGFPRIPLRRIPRYWEIENSRSLCSNKDGSLRVDCSNAISFQVRFLFKEPEGRPRGLTVMGSSIVWSHGSKY